MTVCERNKNAKRGRWRRIALGALTGALMLGALGQAQSSGDAAVEDVEQLLRFCEHDFHEYDRVKMAFETAFPIGSSASELLEVIEKSPGYIRGFHRYRVPDLSVGTEPKFFAYWYGYKCPSKEGNQDIWQIILLSSEEGNLTALELAIFFEDENFSTRGIPFLFENFGSEDAGKRALWSITGKGTNRRRVQEIMENAGLKKFRTYEKDGQITDQYRRFPNKYSILSRLGNFNVWVLNWIFDKDGLLKTLDIN
jgi:hypothetical protein